MTEDAYDKNANSAREVEISFEYIIELNHKYGTKLDKYIQSWEINTLQDLEDCIGSFYNNYNANVEVKE